MLIEEGHRGHGWKLLFDQVLDHIESAGGATVAWWLVDNHNAAMIHVSQLIAGASGHPHDARYLRFEVAP